MKELMMDKTINAFIEQVPNVKRSFEVSKLKEITSANFTLIFENGDEYPVELDKEISVETKLIGKKVKVS